MTKNGFRVKGIPGYADSTEAALLRGRLLNAATEFTQRTDGRGLTLVVSNEAERSPETGPDEQSLEERASYYRAADPLSCFDALVLPQETLERLLLAVSVMELRKQIFDDWDLRSVEAHPSSALNFHGLPGTGKTLAAHAVADRLGRRIICTKYSQLESKYHGEGPKNLEALFYASEQQDAVLFIDEADSLMSQRFEQLSQGSEHAVNAMRSSLLLALDEFEGLVIFATNLVQSYDQAFDSRVRQIYFPVPDRPAREQIWRHHLVPRLPLADDVSVSALAEVAALVGREIRTAVIEAATETRLANRPAVDQGALIRAVRRVEAERVPRRPPSPAPGAWPTPVPAGSEEEAWLRNTALRALARTPEPATTKES